MDAVISYLLEWLPTATIAIIAIGIICFVCWKAFEYHTGIQKTKEKVDNLPCEANKNVLDEVKKELKYLEKTVQSTNDIVTDIAKWIMRTDNNMINTLVKKQSPLKILPIGYLLLDKSNAKNAVDKYIDFLIGELEKENPQAPYDVEDKALTVLVKNTSHELFSEIKSFLYNSPETIKLIDPDTKDEKEIKLSMQIITKLMSIYLRDKYLELHPEIGNEKT
ncbi:hypothetical protein EZS27_003894 [termite gut metagenome]|uniref:Uncharacterized protein n=1 Tax=termite gut metagenome TaxID=433724 RepID=A0A5J4STC4_9ZZZZ